MSRHTLRLIAVLALLAGSLLVDLLVTPAEYMSILYAIPMVVAAWFLGPRATGAVAVAAVGVSVLGAALHPQPSAANWVDLATIVLIALLSYLLSARIRDVQERVASERKLVTAMLEVERRILALARGESQERLVIEGPKEGRELAEAFTRMADEIQQREDRLLTMHEELAMVSGRVLEQAQEAERANERLSAIQSVTGLQLSRLPPDEMVGELLRHLRAALRCDAVAVLLLEQDGRELVVHGAIGLRQEAAVGYRFAVGADVVSRILAGNDPLVVDDLGQLDLGGTRLHWGACSLAGVPLQIGDRVVGVLYAETLVPRRFTDEDVQLARLAADRVVLALAARRLSSHESGPVAAVRIAPS